MKKLVLIGLVLMLGCAGKQEVRHIKGNVSKGYPSMVLYDGVLVTYTTDKNGRVVHIEARLGNK